MQSPDYRKLALEVLDAADDIRIAMLRGFLQSLKSGLEQWAADNPGGWLVHDDLTHDPLCRTGRYRWLSLRKQAWVDNYSIAMGPEYVGGKEVGLGVLAEERRRGQSEENRRIKAKLDECSQGKASQNWPWWVDAPYSDWSRKDVLLDLSANDGKDAADEVCGLMETVASQVAETIDGIVGAAPSTS